MPPPPPPLLPASPPPLQPPFNLVPPPPTSQNDSLGALSSPSTCNASHINPQRVITTRWGLSLPLHLRHQPHQAPTSHYDSLGALSPPPPATPATYTPSTCDASHIKPQRVITTRWGLSLPLHLRRQPHQPPTSHYDSLGALSPLPPATPATSTPNESF